MFTVTVEYEDGRMLTFDNIDKISYAASTTVEMCADDILKHHFNMHYDYTLYSNTSVTTVSHQQLRCINVQKA